MASPGSIRLGRSGKRISTSEPAAIDPGALTTVTGRQGGLSRVNAPGRVCHSKTFSTEKGRVLFHSKRLLSERKLNTDLPKNALSDLAGALTVVLAGILLLEELHRCTHCGASGRCLVFDQDLLKRIARELFR
jgi:hypothetical protein